MARRRKDEKGDRTGQSLARKALGASSRRGRWAGASNVAHEVICRIANLVDRYFLTGSCHLFVSMTPFDKFQYIDRPLVSANSRERLNEMWEQFEKETEVWGDGNLEWLAGQGQTS